MVVSVPTVGIVEVLDRISEEILPLPIMRCIEIAKMIETVISRYHLSG